MQDSDGKILALAFREKSLTPLKLFPLRAKEDYTNRVGILAPPPRLFLRTTCERELGFGQFTVFTRRGWQNSIIFRGAAFSDSGYNS